MAEEFDQYSEEWWQERLAELENADELCDIGMQQGMHRMNLQEGEYVDIQTNCSEFAYLWVSEEETAALQEFEPEVFALLSNNKDKIFNLLLRWSFAKPQMIREKFRKSFSDLFRTLLAEKDGPKIGKVVELNDEEQGLLIRAIIHSLPKNNF